MKTTDLRRKLEVYIAERKSAITISTADLAELLTYEQPQEALARLIAAARLIAHRGNVDGDNFIVSKEIGILSRALDVYDQAQSEREARNKA